MTRILLVDRLEVEGWQDYLLIGSLAFVAIVLLITLLRGDSKK